MQRKTLSIDQLVIDTVQSREIPWVGDPTDQQLAESVRDDGLLQDIIVRPQPQTVDEEHTFDDGDLIGNGEDHIHNTPKFTSDAADHTYAVNDPAGIDTDNTTTHTQRDDAGSDRPSVPEEGHQQYAIVAGSRRYYAALEAGHESVPCKIINADDVGAAWTSLNENTDRRDLSEQEVAQQLKLIYEFVRPPSEPAACPECGQSVAGESGLYSHVRQSSCEIPGDPHTQPADDSELESDAAAGRFVTDRQARTYIAARYLGRTDDAALDRVTGHLRTASLPPILQALFKPPGKRTASEQATIESYGISRAQLGSGEGRSHMSREVAVLYETLEDTVDTDSLDPANAVLETVGELTLESMSEQELRQTVREFRHDVVASIKGSDEDERSVFSDRLQQHADQLREAHEKLDNERAFVKVDVVGPETQRHSRWHSRVMHLRDARGHGQLVRELYLERLEQLADNNNWT